MTSVKKVSIGIFVATLLFSTLAMVQISFAAGKKPVKQTKCPTSWTKIFDGSADSANMPSYMVDNVGSKGWGFATGKQLQYEKIESLINSGCNFQVVKNLSLSEGELTESYVCQYASLRKGAFKCSSGKYSLGENEQDIVNTETKLMFGYNEAGDSGYSAFNGKLYYIPYKDEASTNAVELKIYSRG